MSNIKIVLGKAEVYSACTFSKYNIDTTTGCIMGKDDLNDRCKYCYAKLWNGYKYAPKKVGKNFRAQIRKLAPVYKNQVYIRFGKMTEPGYETDILKEAITIMTEEDAHAIIVTKLLKYDKEMSLLLKINGATIHYSLGDDKLEPGAVKLGMPNKQRTAEARKYIRDGVNVAFRVVVDITQPIPMKYKVLADNGYNLLVTPIRVRDKKLVKDISNYKYFRGFYRPNFIHNSFKNNKHIRFCGELSDGTPLCGMCFVHDTLPKPIVKPKVNENNEVILP